jgi:hypothetical protein
MEGSVPMDSVYILVCHGVVLHELDDPNAAMEMKRYLSRSHPEESYEVIVDD